MYLLKTIIKLNCDFFSATILKRSFSSIYKNELKKRLENKQASLMTKFDDDIKKSMKLILKRRKLNGNKRKDIVATTHALIDSLSQTQSPIGFFSTGSPEQLAIRKEGMPKSFLTTRMKIFNTNFSKAVSEAFLMDQELSKKVDEYKIVITQVRVSQNFKILNIYWTTTNTEIELETISEWLNSQRSRLYRGMIDTHYTNSVPWLSFIYDLQQNYEYEIEKRLKICRKDFKDDVLNGSDNKQENTEEQNNSNNDDDTNGIFSKSISLEDNIRKVDLDRYFVKSLEDTKSYEHLRFESPPGMEQNIGNVDYEILINKVLKNLKKTRIMSEEQSSVKGINKVGEHLPPLNVFEHITANTEVDYNTEERIKSIKKFVQLNKRRVSRDEYRAKKKFLQDEMNKYSSYEELRDKLENVLNKHFEDI